MFRQPWKIVPSPFIIKRFAGHSKWANIKHIKAAKDAQKSSQFLKFARMIRIAIQEGGNNNNPATNSQLKTVIDQALQKDMPMSTIEKNIKKFNPSDMKLTRSFIDIKTLNKVFVIVELVTDNAAKVKMDINTIVRKHKQLSTSLAEIKHLFEEIGIVVVTSKGNFSNSSEFEDKLTEDAIECEAQEVEDIDFESKTATFICKPIEIERVKRKLLNMDYIIEEAQHIFIPNQHVQLTSDEQQAYDNMIQKLKSIEGVENIFDNIEQPTE